MKLGHQRSPRPCLAGPLLPALSLLIVLAIFQLPPSLAKRHRVMRPGILKHMPPPQTPPLPSPGTKAGGPHTLRPGPKAGGPHTPKQKPAARSSWVPHSTSDPRLSHAIADPKTARERGEGTGLEGGPSPGSKAGGTRTPEEKPAPRQVKKWGPSPSRNPDSKSLPANMRNPNKGQWPALRTARKKLPRPVVFKHKGGQKPRRGRWGSRGKRVLRRSRLEMKNLPRPVVFKRKGGQKPRPAKWGPQKNGVLRRSSLEEKKLSRPAVFKRKAGQKPRPAKWGPQGQWVLRRGRIEENREGVPQPNRDGDGDPSAKQPQGSRVTAADVSSDVKQGGPATSGSIGGEESSDVSTSSDDAKSEDSSKDEDSEVWPDEDTATANERDAIADWFEVLKAANDPSAAGAAFDRLKDIEDALLRRRFGAKTGPALSGKAPREVPRDPDSEAAGEAASTADGGREDPTRPDADVINAINSPTLAGKAPPGSQDPDADGIDAEVINTDDIHVASRVDDVSGGSADEGRNALVLDGGLPADAESHHSLEGLGAAGSALEQESSDKASEGGYSDEEDSDDDPNQPAGIDLAVEQGATGPGFSGQDDDVSESSADVAYRQLQAGTRNGMWQGGAIAGTENLSSDARPPGAGPGLPSAQVGPTLSAALSDSSGDAGAGAGDGAAQRAFLRELAADYMLAPVPLPGGDVSNQVPAPAPDMSPSPVPVPGPAPVPSPAPTPLGPLPPFGPPRSPADDSPAPTLFFDGPAPAPGPLDGSPSPVPAPEMPMPVPAPGPIIDGPSPSPAPEGPLPMPAPTPPTDGPSAAPAPDGPVPAPAPFVLSTAQVQFADAFGPVPEA